MRHEMRGDEDETDKLLGEIKAQIKRTTAGGVAVLVLMGVLILSLIAALVSRSGSPSVARRRRSLTHSDSESMQRRCERHRAGSERSSQLPSQLAAWHQSSVACITAAECVLYCNTGTYGRTVPTGTVPVHSTLLLH